MCLFCRCCFLPKVSFLSSIVLLTVAANFCPGAALPGTRLWCTCTQAPHGQASLRK